MNSFKYQLLLLLALLCVQSSAWAIGSTSRPITASDQSAVGETNSNIAQAGDSGPSRTVLGFTFTLRASDSAATVVSESGYQHVGDIEVPDEVSINGTIYPVTTLGTDAFANQPGITRVRLSHRFTRIEARALKGCAGLEHVDLSRNLEYIGDEAMAGCTSLSRLVLKQYDDLPETSPSAFQGIDGSKVQLACGSDFAIRRNQVWGIFSNITVYDPGSGDDYEWVYDYFEGGASSGKLEIGAYPFVELPTNLTLPTSLWAGGKVREVKGLMNRGLANHTEVESVVLPEGIKQIGYYALLESGVAYIELPSTLRTINYWAFAGSKLRAVTLPENVDVVYGGAFAYCDSLRQVTLPGNLLVMCDNIFANTPRLTRLAIKGDVPEFFSGMGGESHFGDFDKSNCTFCVDEQYLSNYVASEMWSGFKNVVTPLDCDDWTQGQLTFSITDNWNNFASVRARDYNIEGDIVIPDSVCLALSDGSRHYFTITSVADFAFQWCDNITRVDVTGNAHTIGIGSFADCANLSSVVLNKGTREIQLDAFSYSPKLAYITLPSSIVSISVSAFYDNGLTAVRCYLNEPIDLENTELYWRGKEVTCYVPSKSLELFKADAWWDLMTLVGFDPDHEGSDAVAGDLNDDGEVTATDVSALIDVVLGGGAESAACDVNGDGAVNAADVSLIIDMILSK